MALLVLYIGYETASRLIRHEAPESSIPGILIASAVVVMLILGRAKRRVSVG